MKSYKIVSLLVIALGVALFAGRHHRAYLKEHDWDAW